MAELIQCPECERQLRVPDTLIGKNVKCPSCAATFKAKVSEREEPAEEEEAAEEETEQQEEEEKELPRAKSRRAPTRRKDEEDEEEDEPPRRRQRRREVDEDEDQDEDEEEDDEGDRPLRRSRRRPHRAGLVLTLGIIGLVLSVLSFPFMCCCYVGLLFDVVALPLNVVAWVLGQIDLGRMSRGEMDTSGEGGTRGGWICGMIGTVLCVLSVGFLVAVFFLGLAANLASLGMQPTRPAPFPTRRFSIDYPLPALPSLPRFEVRQN